MVDALAPTAAPATVQNAGSPPDAAGQSKDGAQSNHDQKSFDLGYGKGLEKAKTAEAERDALKTEIAKLKNAGKSADELKADLDRLNGEIAVRDKKLAAYQERIKADAEARAKALPEGLRKALEIAAGNDPERILEALPTFETIAKEAKPAPPPGGGMATGGPSIDITDYRKALTRGDVRFMLDFEKQHGKSNVMEALKRIPR